MGTLEFGGGGGISPIGTNLPSKHVLGAERPANPYRVSCRSVQGTQKKKKKEKQHAWVEHFTTTPKRPPLRTLFVLCVCGGD